MVKRISTVHVSLWIRLIYEQRRKRGRCPCGTTSATACVEYDVKTLVLIIPVTPVPASRPRVTRWGTYYGKTYSKFRKDAKVALDGVYAGEPLSGGLEVSLWFYCKKPKTTRRVEPRGDVDNYVKQSLILVIKKSGKMMTRS